MGTQSIRPAPTTRRITLVTMADDANVAVLRTIIGVQHAINEAESTAEAVMRIVVDEARAATGAPASVVELAEGDEMVYWATSGTVRGNEGLRLSLSGSLSGQAVLSGKVLTSPDTEDDDRVDQAACRRVHARSMVVVPLLSANRTLGVLKVMSDRPHAFTDQHIRLLEQLAAFIAAALRRATVMDEKTRAASVDSLTGLANRSAFLAALEHAIKSAVDGVAAGDGADPVAAVLYLDLDGFKPINDTCGHAAGDEVLRTVGNRIRTLCTESDIPARIGGDEFAVLLTAPNRPRVLELRDELVALISQPIRTHAGIVSVGVSCGFAVVSGEDLAESVMARADAAMYADKRARSS